MKWSARVRRIILWSAASISVLLAVVWVGSGWWTVGVFLPDAGPFSISEGRIGYIWGPDRYFEGMYRDATIERGPFYLTWRVNWKLSGQLRGIFIPLWAPLGISAAVTALVWRQETLARRRAKHNQCPTCGYDRSGLAPNAPCPECNAPHALPAN